MNKQITKCFNLESLISMDVLKKILTHFTNVTGMRTLVSDYQGKNITTVEDLEEFCIKCRGNPETAVYCYRCDSYAGLEASLAGRPYLYLCHMGFAEAAAPIIVDGVYVGAIFTGNMLLPPEQAETLPRMFNSQNEWDSEKFSWLFKDRTYEQYRTDYPVVSLEKLESGAYLLHEMASHIAGLGAAKLIEQQLNEQEKRILEESRARAELEKHLAYLELQHMQAQTNPHFLFNTLNAINQLTILEDTERACQTITALSNLLRAGLKKSGCLITIEEELGYVSSYLYIKSVTLDNRIHIQNHCDESCKNYIIPFFTIQLLIENAFIHGVEPKEQAGLVSLSIQMQPDHILIEVVDNGMGMPSQQRDMLMSLKNIRTANWPDEFLGIKNVVRGLQFYFENRFDWSIVSTEGAGTKFILRLPLETSIVAPEE